MKKSRVIVALFGVLFLSSGIGYCAAPDRRISDNDGDVLNINSDGTVPVTIASGNISSNLTVGGAPIGTALFNVGTSPGQGLFTVASNGTVGIGTTAPNFKLDVRGTGVLANFAAADNGNDYIYVTNGAKSLTIGVLDSLSGYLYTSGNFLFYTNSVEKMRINTNGNLGIGNTAPLALLDVRGSSVAGTGFAFRIQDSTPTDRLVVTDAGKVGIGTTSPTTLVVINVGDTNPSSTLYLKSSGTGPTKAVGIVMQSALAGDALCSYCRPSSSTGPISCLAVTCP